MPDVMEIAAAELGRSRFRETVLPAYRPLVVRGAARHWPSVHQALRSERAIADHVVAHDAGRPVETFVGPPSIAGRFFYDPTLTGFNFERRPLTLSQSLDLILSHAGDEAPPAIYVGALDIAGHLPGLAQEMRLGLEPDGCTARIWLGNAVEVSPHFDQSHNIACVVAGRRRFTLFPPEQVANLYVGPLEFTVAGQPMGMVSPDAPDLTAHPKFRQALDAAATAVLEPGDAIYIPPLWWHHVRSLEPLNLLVNFWWDEVPAGAGSPFECMVHGLLAIRHLPPAQRQAWRALFDHYVFETGDDPAAHLPKEARGVLGALTPQLARRIREFLIRGLQRG